jgi:hypothetical protein
MIRVLQEHFDRAMQDHDERFNPKKEVSVVAWIEDDEDAVLLVRQVVGHRLWTLQQEEPTDFNGRRRLQGVARAG